MAGSSTLRGWPMRQAWGKASPWVDYSGPVDGKTVGIAILNHPGSFRYPTTWHVRTYGLFAANPFGWHDFGLSKSGDYTLPADAELRFGYRVILHEGDAGSARIADAFDRYAEPPGDRRDGGVTSVRRLRSGGEYAAAWRHR